MRHDTIRYNRTGQHRTRKGIDFYYYCYYYLFPSSHESIHSRAAEEASKQAPKPPARPLRSKLQAAAASRSATGPGWQAGRELPLAGEPYKVALTCKGPSERAEQLGCSLPISIPSRLVVLPSPFCEVVVSSHVQSCPALRCDALRCVVRPRRVDETGRMQLDGNGRRGLATTLLSPPLPLLFSPVPLPFQTAIPLQVHKVLRRQVVK